MFNSIYTLSKVNVSDMIIKSFTGSFDFVGAGKFVIVYVPSYVYMIRQSKRGKLS